MPQLTKTLTEIMTTEELIGVHVFLKANLPSMGSFSLSCRNDSALCTTLNFRVFSVFECWLAEVFSENKTKVKTQFINVN